MPKYLCEADYTAEGSAGLIKDGGSKRREVVTAAIKASGGSVEAFYFAFGTRDVVIIMDLPDNASAAALSLAVAATGSTRIKVTPLLTCAEIDTAAEKARKGTGYRAPGAS